MYINGEWQTREATFPVYNPANGEVIGEVPNGERADAVAAIAAATAAFPSWAASSAYERSAKLYAAHQLMMERRPALAELMTKEQGKPTAGVAERSEICGRFFALVCRGSKTHLRRDHSICPAATSAF